MPIKENKYHSYNVGLLPKGCQYCVKGEKLVLFVTGLCPRKCNFCPVSDEKYQKDIVFANERKVNGYNDSNDFEFNDSGFNGIVKEAELMDAKGAGITGGDPLCKLERTVEYIKKLKETFGSEFHIHLYTSLDLVNKDVLHKLLQAGLNEIRFHLDLDDSKLWKNLELAKQFSWDVGVEIPLIPGKETETRKIVDYIYDKVDFLNLNELEMADNEHSSLLEEGFETKGEMSYAVKDSLESGLGVLEYVREKDYPLKVHLCTAKLKDAVQLSNRIKREAEGARKSFDIVDMEGMLSRGALYLPELKPGFGYREKLGQVDKKVFVEKLKSLFTKIKNKLKLNEEDIFLDKEKPRILLSKKLVKKKKNCFSGLGLVPAIVKEYPTADQLEIEVEFLV